MTRCVDFKKEVGFYKNEEFDKKKTKTIIMRYFRNKVENYKLQDRYITAEWCLNRFKSRRETCNSPFDFEVKQVKLCSNLTAQQP